MKRVIEVQGYLETAQAPELGPWTDLIKAEPLAAFRIQQSRQAGAVVLPFEADDDDVAEVEFADGARLWMRVDELSTELNIAPSRDSMGTLRIPGAITPPGTAERGLGTLLLAGLRLFRVDDALAGLAARELAERLEARRVPGDGLYICRSPNDLRAITTPLTGGEPVLVLLHGTMSSTAGSFGKLSADAGGGGSAWLEIEKRYGRRILAFEHRTLSESPIESALGLARGLAAQIPAGAEIHLVSHSRGGLVGEVLARGQRGDQAPPFDDVDRRIFTEAGDPRWGGRDLAALDELNGILQAQRWKIGRFVRVACPARGTLLASERLDRWLSILLNLLGLAPGLAANPAYDFAKATLLAFAKRRTRPDELPGLAAQMPGSPLVAMLNRQKVTLRGGLSVIAGDCEGRGFWGTLKVLATDLFYREDHDLVVHTAAMDGGAPRADGVSRFLDRGGEVDHFHYFANPLTRERLLRGLDGQADAVEPDSAGSRAPAVVISRTDGGEKPLLFLLPGIMGSHLQVDNERIWVDYDDLLLGGFAKLDLRAPHPVRPDGLLASGYQRMASHLEESHFVVLFDYDWRRSLREAAAAFAAALDEQLRRDPRRDVRILAHSMGGLVVRLAFAERPDLWEEFRRRPGCRFVMAGTPSRGSWSIVAVLLGQDPSVRRLQAVDLRHSMRQILEIVSRFPGLLELLPAPTEQWDFFRSEAWSRLAEAGGQPGWARPADDLLESARQVHLRLAQAPVDPSRMLYVAGAANGTPDRIVLDGREPRVQAFGHGDGRTLWEDGAPAGVPVWYRNAVHGDLLNGDFPAFADLLAKGTTSLLSTDKPPVRIPTRSLEGAGAAVPIGHLPSPVELERAVLGAEDQQTLSDARRPLRVSVVHCNVVYARSPTAVGHYLGDGIFSAEADLDRRLEGALRRRLAVGTYPGAAGTAEVFLPAGREDVGAIVIGLGRIGELTPGALSEGVARGVLRYALTLDERRGRTGASRAARRFSSLLIGSTEGSLLTVEDSLRGVLSGVAAANRALATLADNSVPFLEEVEFIEIWEDRALQIARLLVQLAKAGEIEALPPEGTLSRGSGGRRRSFERQKGGWWQRLQIQQTANGDLSFVAHTDKARVEKSLVPTQVALIRELIRRPTVSTRTDPAIGVTLFELLLPDELKNLSQGDQRLVFQLDREAAQFPWELLVDRGSELDTLAGAAPAPLAVRTGLIRQLETDDFRDHCARTSLQTALVVSDPAEVRGLPPLPGARTEAREVCALLEGCGYEVHREGRFEDPPAATAGTDPLSLLNALMGRGYRILHLAGHGHHDPASPKRSGLVIGCSAAGPEGALHLLTSAEIRQLREVPELVFINACHLGRSDQAEDVGIAQQDRVALAANLGVELIKMGVRAVIAAGWEVNDAAARTFANVFYKAFLAGTSFGEAVQKARDETFRSYPSVNTWGAYQCYGDPYFSLRGPQLPEESAPAWIDPVEARDAIDNLTSDSEVPQRDGGRRVRERLARFEQALPVAWRTNSMVAASLAGAHQELGNFERALELYEIAFQGEAEGVGLKAVEQWVKAVIRDAYESFRLQGSPKPRKDATERIDEATRRLGRLFSFGVTAARLAILGSATKRLAHISDNPRLLVQAARYYGGAYEKSEESKSGNRAYFLVNQALCVYLFQHRAQPTTKERQQEQQSRWLDLVDKAERLASEQREKQTAFECTINLADARLLRGLIERKLGLSAVKSAVLTEYSSVLERGVTPLQARGMEDQFAILQWGLQSRTQRRQVEEVHRELSAELGLAKG